jgi:hypothetical protein
MEYVLFYTRAIEILTDGYHLLLGYNVMTDFPIIPFRSGKDIPPTL